ncbi:unnamed protein product [Polarella glacialis]|uniref:Uncharacterized protein n=1 Tax=Polarella glacialis TaxID=89957 RepID=A0A813GV27_POLGL|nr:unnamed protein product [Polarella glacialis]
MLFLASVGVVAVVAVVVVVVVVVVVIIVIVVVFVAVVLVVIIVSVVVVVVPLNHAGCGPVHSVSGGACPVDGLWPGSGLSPGGAFCASEASDCSWRLGKLFLAQKWLGPVLSGCSREREICSQEETLWSGIFKT